MAKKRRGAGGAPGGEGDGLERLFARLEEAPAGLHDVEPASSALPSGLPPELIELYSHCDGVRLFIDATELVPATQVTMPMPGRWRFGESDGDAISVDQRGRIWRFDPSLDDDVLEGTRLDRWLAGVLEATGLLYDGDGEFADAVFDDEGDVLPEVRERQFRSQLKRDPAAPGPRWRLAHALLEQDAQDDARNELEQVIADDPTFAWAWLDLSRISEQVGDLTTAVEEVKMAAESAEATQHGQAGYFWAQLARLGTRTGDEVLRAQAATKTSLLAPQLKQAQLAGARDSLEAGDAASAKGLLELLRAVWPRDLEVLELAHRIDAAAN